MSKEEKEAIETLIEIKEFSKLSSYLDVKTKQLNAIDIVLNLIDQQQKEIEELKQITMLYNSYEIPSGSERKIVIADTEYFAKGYFVENYIKKDKIRELINKRNAGIGYTSLECIEDIEKLLEE